jgi:hypothetical protein
MILVKKQLAFYAFKNKPEKFASCVPSNLVSTAADRNIKADINSSARGKPESGISIAVGS